MSPVKRTRGNGAQKIEEDAREDEYDSEGGAGGSEGEQDNDEDDNEEQRTLSVTQRTALVNNRVLMNYFKSERLRQAVRNVDSSGDKIGALASYLADPDFASFADDVLRLVAPETYGGAVSTK